MATGTDKSKKRSKQKPSTDEQDSSLENVGLQRETFIEATAAIIERASAKNTEHKEVLLSDIIADENQPRKFFDDVQLRDLSESIKEFGVIEPVLLRPTAEGKYMIVFGERRFRASTLAGMTTIPAMIRTMNDDEALEIQITENLQRHDPHPIEEAAAFAKMAVKMEVKDIALRIGKSPKYVATRLLLNNLLPELQEMFFAGRMEMGVAVSMAKATHEVQQMIITEEVPEDWKTDEHFVLESIDYLLKREESNLDSAPFKTEDADLYPEMGACGGCPFNSANTLSLFIDDNAARICKNATCYGIKCNRAYAVTIEEVKTDPSILFVANWYYNSEDKAKVQTVEEMGIHVYSTGEWDSADQPEPVKPFDEYIKDYHHDEEEESYEEFEAGVREEYDGDVIRYDREVAEYNTALAEGRIKKAFVVVGTYAGKVIDIELTTKAAAKSPTTSTGPVDETTKQINQIRERETRAIELDGEKIWQKIRVIPAEKKYTELTQDLSEIETFALARAMYEKLEWGAKRDWWLLITGISESHPKESEIDKVILSLTQDQYETLCRAFIVSTLNSNLGSHTRPGTQAFIYRVMSELYEPEVTQAEKEQQEKAETRAKRVNERIAALEKKKEPVASTEE